MTKTCSRPKGVPSLYAVALGWLSPLFFGGSYKAWAVPFAERLKLAGLDG